MDDVIVLRSSQKESLLNEIDEKLDKSTSVVHLSVRPTVNILASILTAAPDVKTITCPPSLFVRTPKKLGDALEKIGVDFTPLLLTPGRPRLHPDWKIDKVYELDENGFSVKGISEELDIPLTTVYYYLRK
ncbi:MAG: hypothetical protein V3R82_03065 [Candidatus Hydrothermarchaeales archaeon]